MAVQFINVESFFSLRKFVGPKNPRMSARIAYFVLFAPERNKNMADKFKGRAKNGWWTLMVKGCNSLVDPSRLKPDSFPSVELTTQHG